MKRLLRLAFVATAIGGGVVTACGENNDVLGSRSNAGASSAGTAGRGTPGSSGTPGSGGTRSDGGSSSGRSSSGGRTAGGTAGLNQAGAGGSAGSPATTGGSNSVGGTSTSGGSSEMAGAAGLSGQGGQADGSAGAPNAMPGGMCGGLTGALCPLGQFCNFPIAATCGSGDQTGTCSDTSIGCVAPDGSSGPVCGCDGNTYQDACHAQQLGISVASEGACPNAMACGGTIDQVCPTGQFCNFPIEAQCGTSAQTGACANTDVVCPTTAPAVCGCDGRTYVGPCEAQRAGVSVHNQGTCTT